MARGELLRNLFIGHRHGDEDEFRAAALEIIAEESRKKNNQLARDLARILENGGKGFASPKPDGFTGALPKDRDRQALLVEVRQATRTLSEILLQPEARKTVERIITEYGRAELLRAHSLEPLLKVLFCGPPGCGKTLCAEIIANEIGLPLLYTRFDAIVSSFLGETAANLRKVFDYAASGRWVVLFDEFDAIGKERDDPHEHGEIKRVVNSFLQLLDGFRDHSLLIAATNHERLLDPALWRRFDEIIYFPRPSVDEIRELLDLKMKNFPHEDLDLRTQASRLKGLSHADVERVCLDAIKTCILEDKDSVDEVSFAGAVARQKARLRVSRSAAQSRR